MPRRPGPPDLAWATALAVITILSRWPYRARFLYNWDAVQFALALQEYDVAKHQPHPPGYVLYVALGWVLNAFVHDPTATYVFLAVVFSGLTTFVVYFVGLAVYGRRTARVAASLLAVSPLFWFYGSVGLTYAGEALFASGVAYFAYRALQGRDRDAWFAAGHLGLAGGMRQSLLVLLLPLWLGAVVVGRGRVRTVLIGLGVMVGAVLVWFVPMIWLTGGLGRYLEASMELAESVVRPTLIVTGSLDAHARMSRYLVESVLVGLGPLAAVGVLVPWYLRRYGWGRPEWFLLGWVLPPILVYTLVHFGQAGYALTFLPALVIFLARVLVAAVGHAAVSVRLPRVRRALTMAVVVLVVLVNGAFFVSARPSPRDFDTPGSSWKQLAEAEVYDWVFSRTAAALHEHEEVVRTFIEAIQGLYSPADTVIVTELGNPRSYAWLRHAMFYLPAYAIYELRVGTPPLGYYAPRLASAMVPVLERQIRLANSVKRVVWFVDHWSPAAPRPPELVEIELPHGRYLYVLGVGRRPIEYAGYTLTRDEPRKP
jgi:dolichyl-phosphate-mannose-protein mannosyltransferase